MRVQIYSLTHPDDVRALLEMGVDHIGIAPGQQDVPAQVDIETGRELFSLVPEDRETVALTVHESLDPMIELATGLKPDILHVCSDTGVVDPAGMRALRDRLPAGMDLMKAIEVGGPSAVAEAERVAPVSDWLILDTATTDVPGIGASGRTHDWSISREIVEAVEVPVILAGGLGPANVAEAVRTVRPAGVDSYSLTSRTERRKDHDRTRGFVDAARTASAELSEV
ncbi:MAG: phosphoribosylanthranilate isomerase [Halobacteriales archaeon]